MSSRSLRPLRAAALWCAAWILCCTVGLAVTPEPGHAFVARVLDLKDSQSWPTDDRNGGDPDGVGLSVPEPPHGGPPFAPDPDPLPRESGGSLSPQALRL